MWYVLAGCTILAVVHNLPVEALEVFWLPENNKKFLVNYSENNQILQNILLRRETNMQISLLGREQHFIFSGKCETQKVETWESQSLGTRKVPKREKEKSRKMWKLGKVIGYQKITKKREREK